MRIAYIRSSMTDYVALSPGDLTFTESSVFDPVPCRKPQQDPSLIPLPDASADSGLDWSDLVDAAKAFEGIRDTLGHLVHKPKLKNSVCNFFKCSSTYTCHSSKIL